jgi:hypothetical protein
VRQVDKVKRAEVEEEKSYDRSRGRGNC